MTQPQQPQFNRTQQVSSGEVYQIFTIPAVAVDKFYATMGKGITRITFAESVPGTEEKIPRYSIFLTDQALSEFSSMLAGILKSKSNPQAEAPKVETPQKEELN